MSQRLKKYGRYPKSPNIEQTTSVNSQFPQPTPPVTSQVPFFNPSLQPQTGGQNAWTQPLYSNPNSYQPNHVPSQPDYSNPNTFQQNPATLQPVPQPGGYWSGGQMHAPPSQPQWNESWNYKPENIAEGTAFTNYQQPEPVPPAEQWQQIPYSQIDNQNYPQQSLSSYNETNLQGYQYPPEYQPTNNNSNVSSSNAQLPTWENGSLNVTRPEHLPWTYSSPQYSDPIPPAVTDFSQSVKPTTNTISWPSNSNYVSNAGTDFSVSEESPATYLNPNPESIADPSSASESRNSSPCIDPERSKDPEADDPSDTKTEKSTVISDSVSTSVEQPVDVDYAASTLSAFFQDADQSELGNSSEQDSSTTPVLQPVGEVSSQEGIDSPVPFKESGSQRAATPSSGVGEETHSDEENNFVQEENVIELGEEEILGSNTVSPSGFNEEPINQEVPEPPRKDSSIVVSQSNKEYNEILAEEPPNQQIPAQSGQTSRSTSAERERLVIRPREDSPFKPPRPSSSKGIVVQQEIAIQSHTETKHPEGNTVVQEVNLETFPDNLERPSDYEELRKQSPLYVSHKHLRSELNSSPSSLLCDNIDIPCVTLAPAAPPLSSSKSDKSESSTSSRAESLSLGKSNLSSYTLNESNSSSLAGDSLEMDEKSSSRKLPGKVTSSVLPSGAKDYQNTSVSEPKKYDNRPAKPARKEKFNSEKADPYRPVYLKDSKVNGNNSAANRDTESLQRHSSNSDLSNTSMGPPRSSRRDADLYPDERADPQRSSRRDADLYPDERADPRRSTRRDADPYPDERADPRYPMERLESNRQRFSDQKYPSFDDRQYYAERERSRPSSRTSLRERPDDYPYHPKEDYSYPPSRGDPRRYPPDYPPRPSSRTSETDVGRSDRQGYNRQPYPYPPSNYPRGSDPRDRDYYQRPPNQRGYEYDPYQRDPYYSSYYDAYRYAYSNYNYGYYDEIYRNDPRYQQYQEQYRQYYARYGYDVDYDRSSGHSGRSSANELSKEGTSSGNYPEPDIDSIHSEYSGYNAEQSYDNDQNEISNIEAILDQASTPSSRLTPVKFSYAHPIARFSPGGLLITAIPSQTSTVPAMPIRIHNIQAIREDEESFQELKSYQGPLIRGSTHKNDVIEFCSQKIKVAKLADDIVDRESYILLWELMVLLLRQNGSVAGSDIAELLLKDHEVLRPPSLLKHTIETPLEHSPADVNDSSSQSHAGDTSSPDEGIVVLHDKTLLNTPQTVDVDKLTRKFREFLLFGHKKDALEWAMKHGLWGHALFLASKMDLRTYANVMTRFANSLALNDPLQTLYQLMSGRQPIAVTNVVDKRWGDWRPHLAMILSNPSSHPDVDSRSITTLGDTLASRGCLCAAHFCYIMAQVEFGTYEQKNSKLVLLTADHMLPFEEFATNEAIQVTEIYEYAQSLANASFMLVHLQLYKFWYAMRLVEHGFFEEALHYCEIISSKLQAHPHLFQLDFVSEIFKYATLLKYHDPHFLRGQGEYEDQDDPDWLKNLSTLVQNFNNFNLGDQAQSYYEQQQEVNQQPNANLPQQFSLQSTENVSCQNVPSSSTQTDMNNSYNHINTYQPTPWNQQNSMTNSSFSPNGSQLDNVGYYQSDLGSNQGSFHRQNSIPSHEENETTDVPSSPVTQTPPFDYYSGGTQQVLDNKHMYESSNNFSNTANRRERRDSALSSGSRYSTGSMSMANKSSAKEVSKQDTKKDKQATQAGKTWLGGIFSRLMPKAPNQMILPDDKNPTIVWDDVKNCWVNKDSNDDDETNAPLAPPTDMELMGSKSSTKTFQAPGTSMPPSSNSVPPASGSHPVNKFQRPKTKGMRQNYVDVLSTSGATKKTTVLSEGLFPSPYENFNSQQMFTPVPTSTSGGDNSAEMDSNYTNFSSTQFETGEQTETQSTPLMFDPSEFDARRSSGNNQRLTLGRTGRRTYPT